MMWHQFDGLVWSEPGMLHGVVFWIFLISAAVVLIVWIAGLFHGTDAKPPPGRALDILEMRDAKGETGREQFDEMKRELRS